MGIKQCVGVALGRFQTAIAMALQCIGTVLSECSRQEQEMAGMYSCCFRK